MSQNKKALLYQISKLNNDIVELNKRSNSRKIELIQTQGCDLQELELEYETKLTEYLDLMEETQSRTEIDKKCAVNKSAFKEIGLDGFLERMNKEYFASIWKAFEDSPFSIWMDAIDKEKIYTILSDVKDSKATEESKTELVNSVMKLITLFAFQSRTTFSTAEFLSKPLSELVKPKTVHKPDNTVRQPDYARLFGIGGDLTYRDRKEVGEKASSNPFTSSTPSSSSSTPSSSSSTPSSSSPSSSSSSSAPSSSSYRNYNYEDYQPLINLIAKFIN